MRPLANNPEPRGQSKPRATRWLWLLIVIAAAGGGFWLFGRGSTRASGAGSNTRTAPGRLSVSAIATRKGDIPVYQDGLGSVAAFYTVTVKSRVAGQLMRYAVQEGQVVKEGDLIAEIDPRPFQVQLEQAEGQLAHDEALLNNARIDLARYRDLSNRDAIPRQQLDTQVATLAQYEGTVKTDQGAVDSAKLQLTYCRIEAPVSGRVGLRIVDPGNMVQAGDTGGLIVLTQVQPITVLFTIPQDALPPVLKKLNAGERLRVDALDRDGRTRIATGRLLTADNQIDASTGTCRLKAVFENKDGALFPNQFVNARLLLEIRRNRILIPASAIQRGPQENFVYVVANGRAHMRPIQIGITEGNDASIDSGLSEGEMVVVDGGDKLRDDAEVDLR